MNNDFVTVFRPLIQLLRSPACTLTLNGSDAHGVQLLLDKASALLTEWEQTAAASAVAPTSTTPPAPTAGTSGE
jgi:hypothetical protein